MRYMKPVHVIINHCQVTELKAHNAMQGGHGCMDTVVEFEVISMAFLPFLQVKLPKHIYYQNLSLVKAICKIIRPAHSI